jgi:hypothetical protein
MCKIEKRQEQSVALILEMCQATASPIGKVLQKYFDHCLSGSENHQEEQTGVHFLERCEEDLLHLASFPERSNFP